ncbi:YIP1 family protein [Chitinophaga qingshengii]|uniref:Yip1 domain-containing protein n=1 Tax=Chitinophaga qingshengii TaxID=1569794 RepID=A0ABR7TP07_9BACT|nr:YIP1 family protein [Chitinophaga qingshengii]MBC9932210.1 hypothetical protein [Chitinophaga qingshengii]
MNTWLFRPFTYIAGGKALLTGWLIMLFTSVVAYFSKTHFDGAIDAHSSFLTLPYFVYLLETLIAWGSVVICCYTAAVIFARTSFRFIDLAGTTALARTPMLGFALLNFIVPPVTNISDVTPMMLALSLAGLPFLIWTLILLYQAFSVSTNMKGNKAILIFIGSLLVAEALSKVLLHYLFPIMVNIRP